MRRQKRVGGQPPLKITFLWWFCHLYSQRLLAGGLIILRGQIWPPLRVVEPFFFIHIKNNNELCKVNKKIVIKKNQSI